MRLGLRILQGLIVFYLVGYAGAVWAMSVVFLNPGRSDEVFWLTVSKAMQAAAHDLNVELQIYYAERDHQHMLTLARELLNRPAAQRPDYVVLSNDYDIGVELLRILDQAGIKAFFANSSINASDQRQYTGAPRSKYAIWLGSLEPNAEDAGYQTARILIAKGRAAGVRASDGKLHIIALAGDRSSSTSVYRNNGLRKAVTESVDVVIDQFVYADWKRNKAGLQSSWLYQRYPETRLVWAANDQMAFGAMDSWQQRGGQPGKDAWFSAINNSSDALHALQAGRLTALAGGHAMIGAWALIVLYDYHHGHDFIDEGLQMNRNMLSIISPDEVATYEAKYGDLDFSRIDFRRFSKVLNPRLKHYDFRYRQLLK